jgi:hypothetical protein
MAWRNGGTASLNAAAARHRSRAGRRAARRGTEPLLSAGIRNAPARGRRGRGKKSVGFSPGAGVLWVAMIAAGAFFIHGGPLQGSHPAATDPEPYSDQRSMARQLRFKPTCDVLLDGVRRDYAH